MLHFSIRFGLALDAHQTHVCIVLLSYFVIVREQRDAHQLVTKLGFGSNVVAPGGLGRHEFVKANLLAVDVDIKKPALLLGVLSYRCLWQAHAASKHQAK